MASRDADRRQYKTVAMPSAVRGGRKLGRTKAERVANAMADIINVEAEAGWTYLGSDAVRMEERVGLFGRRRETVYTVLVFERGGAEAPRQRASAFAETAAGEGVRRRAAAEPPLRERGGREAERRNPERQDELGAAADAVRRQAAEAADQRQHRRGYGFDDELTADRDGAREQRPLRRREARVASRRAQDAQAGQDGWLDDAPSLENGRERGRRGLVETMRSHRDRT